MIMIFHDASRLDAPKGTRLSSNYRRIAHLLSTSPSILSHSSSHLPYASNKTWSGSATNRAPATSDSRGRLAFRIDCSTKSSNSTFGSVFLANAHCWQVRRRARGVRKTMLCLSERLGRRGTHACSICGTRSAPLR